MAAGYQSRCGYRVGKRSIPNYPTNAAEASSGARTLGAGDLLPYSSEGLAEEYQFETQKVLQGIGAPASQIITGKLGGGKLVCPAHYLGLDQLIACALGYEVFSLAGAESPEYSESILGLAASDTVHPSSTSTRIVATTPNFFGEANDYVVGEWIRAPLPGSPSMIVDNQVRRVIFSSASGNYADVTPGFSSAPVGRPFQIARAFTHTFECALDLGIEHMFYGEGSYHRVRHGTLCVYKVLSTHEFRGVMVNSMTFRMSPDDASFEFDLLFFDLDLRTSGRNSDPSPWAYSSSPLALQERIRLGDAVFRLGPFSTTTPLGVDKKLGISSFEITVNNNLGTFRETSSGLYRAEPTRDGFREVRGNFTLPRFSSESRLSYFRSDEVLMADLQCTGSPITGVTTRNALKWFLRSLKLTKVTANVSGPGLIEERAEFVCIPPSADPAGMPAQSVDADRSELIIQTVNSFPYNAQFDQNGE